MPGGWSKLESNHLLDQSPLWSLSQFSKKNWAGLLCMQYPFESIYISTYGTLVLLSAITDNMYYWFTAPHQPCLWAWRRAWWDVRGVASVWQCGSGWVGRSGSGESAVGCGTQVRCDPGHSGNSQSVSWQVLATNTPILFCWLFNINDNLLKKFILQTHYQGLRW